MLLGLCLCCISQISYAEGTKQLSPTASDTVFLVTNDVGFGDFASYDGPEVSKLKFKIMDHTNENMYIGLSKRVSGSGSQTTNPYYFRIVDSMGNIVKPAVIVNPIGTGAAATQENASTWALASSGPDILGGGGYSTADSRWVFDPTFNGVFTIEFSEDEFMDADDQDVNILWYDFTVVSDPTGTPTEEPGRLWSQLWSLRTPQQSPVQVYPDCQWDREFNGTFYTYTSDGFVSRVNFDGSGFQGLNFSVAFGSNGPGTSGDIVLDRQSIHASNATANAADHMTFVNIPDILCFPTPADSCGTGEIVKVECLNNDSFCIFVTTTLPGQVELLLEFNTPNGQYDPDSNDVVLAQTFPMAPDTLCIPWDGLKADGSPLVPGEPVPVILRYTQGVQHYAAYDVEFLKNGFCVETVRPLCPGAATNLLYWDDTELPDLISTALDERDPGTGQPLLQLNGDTCQLNGTRTWTNFGTALGTCSGPVSGYGEIRTMNTWWFAAVEQQAPFSLPILTVALTGDSTICAGDSTQFFAIADPDTVTSYTYLWSGPSLFSATTDSTGFITEAGVYCVTVTDTIANCVATECRTLLVNSVPVPSIAFTCTAANSPNGDIDLTISGGMMPFATLWSNGAMTEDLMDVPPGTYSVIITDDNGCMAFDTVVVEGCCTLDITCPPIDGGIYTCLDSVPAADVNIVTVNDFCAPLDITFSDTDNGGLGCATDPLIISREYYISDGAGSLDTCRQTFTVIDNENPSVVIGSCPSDTTVICNSPTDPMTLGAPSYTDNCTPIGQLINTFRSDSTGFDGSCTADEIGSMVRTFFSEDLCGNIDSNCMQRIIVIDSIAPTFTLPMDMTIECTVDTFPTTTGGVTGEMDNCSNVLINFADIVVAGTCPAIDTVLRTWTVTDDCGNSSTGLQTIVRVDTQAPTFTAPANLTIQCTDPIDPASTGEVLDTTDNCSAITIRFEDEIRPGTCPVIDTIARSWIAVDACDNADTLIQFITRIDTVAPTFTVPVDIELACTSDILTSTTGEVLDTTDNCSAFTLAFVDMVVPGSCSGQDTIFRTWTATDACNNANTQVQIITRIDTVAPVITFCPPDITVDCTGSLDTTATGTPLATDDCDDVTITFTDQNMAGTCSSDNPVMRLFTATDDCGNASTCLQNITIQDTESPMLVPASCPADITIDCTVDLNTIMITPPSYTDNCSDPQLIVVSSRDDTTGFDGTCTNLLVGSIIRTYFGTDICGNIDSTCVVTLNVQDIVGPTFTTPADITLQCGMDTLPSTTGMVLDTLDACSGVSLDFSDLVVGGTCTANDTVFRTWTATDGCGNMTTGIQTIVRIDNIGPLFTTPVDITIQCSQDSLPATTGDVIDATDNCSDLTISFTDAVSAGSCDGEDVIVRTWSVEDACGNISLGVQTITRIDTVAPTFTVPVDTVIACDQDSLSATTGDVSNLADNCSTIITPSFVDLVIAGDCPAIDTIYRTWSVSDDCGNIATALQTITRIDTIAPMLDPQSCPLDITIECTDLTTGLGAPTFTDNCGVVDVTFSDVSTGFVAPSVEGVITRTFTGTDDCGNVDSTCVQTITVEDSQPPMFTFCPPDLTLACPPDADTMFTGVPLFIDNCNLVDDISLSFSDDSVGINNICFEGTINRTFTIVDIAGNINESCVQAIMVIDTVGPTFDPPADMTVDCDADLDDVTITGTVSNVDDCSSIRDTTYVDVFGMMGCDGIGPITRTWSVSDGCGNISTAIQMIMVQDTLQPDLTPPADITISCELNPMDTSITGSMVNVNDNCSMNFMISFTDDVTGLDGCNGTGVIVRTWFAEDDCDNIGQMSQNITIIDTTAPTALCQDVTIDFENANEITLDAALVDDGSSDNCGGVNFMLSQSVFGCLEFSDVQSIAAVLTVSDDCGNSSTCDFNVVGFGGAGVSIECPNDILIQLGPGECERIVNYEITTSPICGGGDATVAQTDDSGLTSGDAFPIGVTLQSYIAFDEFGDTAFCDFTITILEYPGEFNPACNDTLNISLDQNCEAIITPEIILEGEDFGCGADYIIEIEGIGSSAGMLIVTDPEKGIYYTVSITDPETGLSCWGTILFEDKIPPIIECPCEDYEAIDRDAFEMLGTFEGHTYYVSTGTFSWQAAEAAAAATSGHLLSVSSANENQFIVDAFEGNDFRVWIGLTDDEAYGGNEAGTDPLNGWVWTDGSPVDFTNWSDGEPNNSGGNEDYAEMFGNGLWNDIANTTFIQRFILEVDGICEFDCLDPIFVMPVPIAYDACNNIEVVSLEDTETGDECEGLIVTRTWVVQDGSGNSASCSQNFVINPLSLDSLVFPENYIGECGESIDPSFTGSPTIQGVEIGASLCNIYATHWDKELTDCGGGIKIVRTWTIVDWCTQEIVEREQVIKLTDNEGPVMTCPDDIVVNTDFWYCQASVSIPKPEVFDACGTDFTLALESADGLITALGNNYVINDLEIGDHIVTWIATDACGNSSSCSFTITVEDQTPPVPNCDLHTIVSLTIDGPQGITLVDASVFDDGSYDNCGPVTFRARRMTSCIDFDWTTAGAGIDDTPNGIVNQFDSGMAHGPKVPFACCDVAPLSGSVRAPIMVELEVTDGSGNKNYCMVEIEVQDKIAPLVECLPNIVVSCDFWFDDDIFLNTYVPIQSDPLASVFGTMIDAYDVDGDEGARQPIIINDPGNNTIGQPYEWGIDGWADDNCNVIIDVRTKIIDDCSGDDLPSTAPDNAVRYIERIFRVRDNRGNVKTCKQIIWVVDFKPFYISDQTCNNPNPNDGVIWPCDELYETCPDSILVKEPVIFDDNCSLIGVTYEDTRFDFVDGACYKILRDWKVIDWCQYDANTGAGLWSYTQVIKVIDSNGPAFTDCPVEPVTLCAADEEISLPDNNQVFQGEDAGTSCSVHVRKSHFVEEFCSGTVTYDVKVYPFNGPDFVQVQPKKTVSVGADGIAELILDTKSAPQISIRNNGLPYNSPFCGDYHKVLWTVEDGCGNTSTCSYLLRLEDCKQPSPVCINGLSTVVMPSNGSVTLWAKEFDASSIDDCTHSENLLFSFNGNSYQPSMNYTCDNVPAFDVEFSVEVWVADEGVDHNCNGQIEWSERNKDFCTTTLVITDNDQVCGGSGSVLEGEVMTHEDLQPVENAMVRLTSPNGFVKEMVTADDGVFRFLNLPEGEAYNIEPIRNDDHINGVSTLDLVRIQKHLLGIEPFDTPYLYIAADANNSQNVSAVDLIEIRKLILGVYTEFPNNTSWRFVNEDFSFADQMDPWPFQESISIEVLTQSSAGDFMAVKVGDLNQTVVANLAAGQTGTTQVVTRGGHATVKLQAKANQVVKAGETVDVEIVMPADMLGLQWTLDLDGLIYTQIKGDILGEDNVAVHGDKLTMSYGRVSVGESLSFTMSFVAEKNGRISDMIQVSSDITNAEGYLEEPSITGATESIIEIVDIDLEFVHSGKVEAEYALYQNEPNPFSEYTIVGFTLPEDMDAQITLFDVSGKIVKEIPGKYLQGYNYVRLSKKDLPGNGIFYYSLNAETYSATKKLILTE